MFNLADYKIYQNALKLNMFKCLLLLLICLLAVNSKSTEFTGVKLLVNKDLMDELENKLIPPLVKYLNSLEVPNQSLEIDVALGTKLLLELSKIKIQIDNLLPENLEITFQDPNLVQLKLRNLNGTGHFDVKFSYLLLGENDSVDFTITNLQLTGLNQVTSQESRVNPGKILPSLNITSIEVDFDFDFDISGPVIAKVASLFKSLIKPTIKERIKSAFKNIIVDQSKILIPDLISNQTVYYNLTDMGFALDYSLVTAPVVEEQNLVINSYFRLEKLNFSNSKSDSIEKDTITNNLSYLVTDKLKKILNNLHSKDNKLKAVTLQISPEVLNSALATLFNQNLLKLSIKSEDIPQNFLLQLNTTTLDVFLNNLSKVYGKDKKVETLCSFYNQPQVSIEKNNLSSNLDAQCELKVNTNEDLYDSAMNFTFSSKLSLDLNLSPGGHINASIEHFEIDNSHTVSSKVEGADIKYLEQFLDFGVKIVKPMLNENYLNNITISLPKIAGINIDDSNASLENGYLQLAVNPDLPENVINSFFKKLEIKSKSLIKKVSNSNSTIKLNLEKIIRFLQ